MKNIKLTKIISLTIALLLMLSVGASAKTLEFKMGSVFMYESDETFETYLLENAPYTKNDRTMVPIRIISERFGADVTWDEATSQVGISKDGKNIILTLGSSEAVVNGANVTLDVAPEEINGRTMVPLRFVSETLEMKVEYVPLTQQVLITNTAPVMTVGGVDITVDDYMSFMAYIGYDPEADDKLEVVKSATDTFKETYASAAYVLANGHVQTNEFADDTRAEIEPYESDIHRTALSAPTARLLESSMVVSENVAAYMQNEDITKDVIEYYINNYITAKHILVSTQERSDAEAKKIAEGILKKLKSGADFDSLMAENGEDPGVATNPDGYTFTKGEMVEEFEKASFALKEGALSGLVKSDFGYHIIKRMPLADLDAYNAYAISETVAYSRFDAIAKEAVSNAKIDVYMTDEQIAHLIK